MVIFRKYEFIKPEPQTPDDVVFESNQEFAEYMLSQVHDGYKIAVIHLGELTPDKWSVDVLWKGLDVCPEILWDYIFIGEQSSHYFLDTDPQSYLPIPLTLVEEINGV